MQKDELANRALRNIGYTVFRFWSQDILKKGEASGLTQTFVPIILYFIIYICIVWSQMRYNIHAGSSEDFDIVEK